MLEITQARPEEHHAAFELAYRRTRSDVRRLQVAQALKLLAGGVLDPAGIWIARQAGKVCGVQIAVPLGGASFLFWLPEVLEPRGIADALVEAALHWCASEGGRLAQLFVPPADAARAAPLLRHGFEPITRLCYLEHDLKALPCEPPSRVQVRCERFTPVVEACFRETLAGSYEGTLDCPELSGARSVEEVLAGYRASKGGPAPWWLVWADEEPAGVVIMTELPEGPAWDLSYLGVLPRWRRHGLGRMAAGRAVRATHAAGAVRMVLAVDERNDPARRLYETLGFIETEVRNVFLHFFTEPVRSVR
jgi:mycothiol synthase